MRKIIFSICFFLFNLIYSQLTYTVCDNDDDGIYNFSISDREKIVKLYQFDYQEEAEIYITVNRGGILKVKNLESTTPTIEFVCAATVTEPTFFEIAVNSKKEIFVTNAARIIYKVDSVSCEKTAMSTVADHDIQALSFDRLDNLYKSDGTSLVSRASANDFDNFIPWHDFGSGFPSGDFVMVDDKMYISWAYNRFGGLNDLFEVTVDDDFNYISHVNLGAIRNDTWGLASEYGKLYGVTYAELYEINPKNLSTKTILTNPRIFPNAAWWGAAGKHEAIKLQEDLFESYEDAQNNVNVITFPYQNRTPFKQTIYLRSENIYTGETKIVSIDLVINPAPRVELEKEYILCYNGAYGTTIVDTKLSTDTYSFEWFHEGRPQLNDKSSLSVVLPGLYKVIVTDQFTGCSTEKEFSTVQSEIFINNVTTNQEYILVEASGTDHPFTYMVDNVVQQNPRFDSVPLGEISVFAINNKKCISQKIVKSISINNVISPNSDGINDYFELKNTVFKNSDFKINIVNKYGTSVHQSKVTDTFKWDGRDAVGRPLPTGTYWYSIYSAEKDKRYTGFILLKNY